MKYKNPLKPVIIPLRCPVCFNMVRGLIRNINDDEAICEKCFETKERRSSNDDNNQNRGAPRGASGD